MMHLNPYIVYLYMHLKLDDLTSLQRVTHGRRSDDTNFDVIESKYSFIRVTGNLNKKVFLLTNASSE